MVKTVKNMLLILIGVIFLGSIMNISSYDDNLFPITNEGQIIDDRDGQSYDYVQIGELLWLKQNMNYAVPASECYENEDENCEKYGRMYSYSDSKKACPKDWHLPTPKEWKTLRKVMKSVKADKIIKPGEWEGEDYLGATDELGLSILPGGRKDEHGASWRESMFGEKGTTTSYWLDDSEYHWHIRWGKSHIHKHGDISKQGRKFYVRCLCDVK